MEAIKYVDSMLDMSTPLERSRVLIVKGKKAGLEQTVEAELEISIDPSFRFMKTVVDRVLVLIKAKRVDLPESVTRASKYKPVLVDADE
ncbi:hypothetical protein AGMMS49975_10100 [Clostridia bacterium]|nr:hypothetical protein AGMMS49975_10100 [Clostridia bacterium]